MNPRVIAICICPKAGEKMQMVSQVRAIAGCGLEGDRYATNNGSFNKGRTGARQVTFINSQFFRDTEFEYIDSRRNIVTEDVELMWLINREFQIGEVRFRGIKYCDPCNRPSKISGKTASFKEAFFDRGGLVAEILEGGEIHVGDIVTLPEKGY